MFVTVAVVRDERDQVKPAVRDANTNECVVKVIEEVL